MKQSDFLDMLEIARAVPNFYKNKYPYNLGYHHSGEYKGYVCTNSDGITGNFSFDCWNLIKVVLSGWTPNIPIGSHVEIKDLVTGDIDGKTMMQKCTARSRNFSKLSIPGTYLYLESDPHSGIYIGDKIVDGKTVNVIECTKSSTWKANGVVYSYVDASGRRFNYKGGKQSLKWSEHGLLPWVEYTDIPEVKRYDSDKFKDDVCSILGVDSVAAAFLKTVTISTIWNKHNALVTPLERYFKALGYYQGEIEADLGKKPTFGPGMEKATKLYQKYYVGSTGRNIDGVLTKQAQTWKKLLLG